MRADGRGTGHSARKGSLAGKPKAARGKGCGESTENADFRYWHGAGSGGRRCHGIVLDSGVKVVTLTGL